MSEEIINNPEEEKEEPIKDILGDPIKEDEEELEPVVQKLRKGYGRVRVMDKANMEIFRYDYKTKTTDIKSVIEYLTTKYKDCRLEVLE